MPEQITKYPEVTMRVLEGSGANCGKGAKQEILTQCPPDQFCSLQNGEVCIYGIEQISSMTQITTSEIAEVVCTQHQGTTLIPDGTSMMLISVFAAGIVAGFILTKFGNRLKPGNTEK